MTEAKVFIVCGLGFGDEGKGTITDFLCRRHGAKLVVRYNGGPQAAHNVVTPDGTRHCFAQFGAGTLAPGFVRTLLARQMLVSPADLVAEGLELERAGAASPFPALNVDPDCTLVTPLHQLVGQLTEISRGDHRFGSCGKGVGQAVRDSENGLSVTFADIFTPIELRKKLTELAAVKLEEAGRLIAACNTRAMRERFAFFFDKVWVEALCRNYVRAADWLYRSDRASGPVLSATLTAGEKIVFEGAQGALLDRSRGFAPYVTQSRTTAENAQDLLAGLVRKSAVSKIGVLRAYGHRHGPGPFVTESDILASRISDPLNPTNCWQGAFRVGWLDLVALRYGIALNGGVDSLAVTCLDQLSGLKSIRLCDSYDCPAECRPDSARFEWERVGGGRTEIFALKTPGKHASADSAVAGVLERCSPAGWQVLRGWNEDISGCRCFSDLPANAQAFLEFLSGKEGLGVPIRLVSVGPRADQKFEL